MRKLYWNEGFSQNALADVFGVSQANVSQIVRGERYPGVEMPDTNSRPSQTITVSDSEVEEVDRIAEEIERRKSKHTANNLSPEEVVKIRWQFWLHATDPEIDKLHAAKQIAADYGMCAGHIKGLCHGRKWPYVDGPTSRAEFDEADPPSELDLNLNGHA
jgi:predicted transcriptional regulator